MKVTLALAALSISGSYAAVAAVPRATPAPIVERQAFPDTSKPLPTDDPAALKAYTESVFAGYASVIAAHPEAKDNILSASSIFQDSINVLNSLNDGGPGDVITTATIGMNTGVPQKTTVTNPDGMVYTPYIADAPGDVTYSYEVTTKSPSQATSSQATQSTAPAGSQGGGAATIKPAFAAILALVGGAFML